MTNSTKRLVTLAAGVAALGGAAIGLGGFEAASAHAVTHTFRITTTQLQDRLVNGVDIATDKDTQHGSTTGYDVTACRVNVVSHVARCDVALARAGGLIYGHAAVNLNTGLGSGAVTGGTRHFQGASGTFAVDGARVTVTWSN